MVALNTALAAPEEGWLRVEDTDPNFVYIGTWGNRSNGAYSSGSQKTQARTVAGNRIEFKFYGSKIRIISSTYPTYTNDVRITIDDVSEKYSLSYDTNVNRAMVYEKTGLKLGGHMVTVERLSSGSYSNDFFWDAIDIDDIGMMLDIDTPLFEDKILLLSSSGELNKVMSENNSVPHMISLTEPSGIVRASVQSAVTPGGQWRAFNGILDKSWDGGWRTGNRATNQWISYEFQESVYIDTYEITSGNATTALTAMPRNLRLEASNDGDEWLLLDRRSELSWQMKETKVFRVPEGKTGNFKIYRVFVESNNGYAEITIPSLQLLGNKQGILSVTGDTNDSLIEYGISLQDLASIDMSANFTEKHYIQNQSAPLGDGKVFEQALDINKIVNKVEVK